MVKVKLCGITNLEDALAAVFLGVDAIGFVFYKKSPRYIDPKTAKQISLIIPKKIKKVGVFVDASLKQIKKIARDCRLDYLQFHGNESPEFCQRFADFKVIKAFRIKNKIEHQKLRQYKTYGVLFDTFAKSIPGGSGNKFNWKIFKQTDRIKHPFFLSGGLTSQNVSSAIKLVRPDWVDVSSSVELKPGKKDHKKIQRFVKAVRR